MDPDLSLSPRHAWLAGLVGGGFAGLADAISVVTSARIGLGTPGVVALVLSGVVLGPAVGGVAAMASSEALRRRIPLPAAVVLGAASIGAVRVGLDAVHGALGAAFLGGGPAIGAAVAVMGAAIVLVKLVSGGARFGGPRASWALLAATLVALAGVAFGGRVSPPPPRIASAEHPNVLLVTFGGARADRFGPAPIDTPGFDRVASEGTAFSLAVTPSTDALTAARALIRARDPWAPEEEERGRGLGEAMSGLALTTGAFVSTDTLGRGRGLDEGFHVYDDDHDWPKGISRTLTGRLLLGIGATARQTERRADEVVDRAIRFIEGQPGQWFVWVHLDDPMPPYEPPVPYDERYYRGADPRTPALVTLPADAPLDPAHGSVADRVRDAAWLEARYDGEVAYADAALARLQRAVDDLGVGSHTLVVATSLMGSAMREGDQWFSPDGLLEAQVHIPLAMRLAGRIPVGQKIAAPVSLTDVAPTVIELIGGKAPMAGATGVSLRATLEGSGVARRYARAVGPGPVRATAVRLPGALVVHDPRGADRAWRFRAEEPITEVWTPQRVLDVLAWAVEVDGTGGAPPVQIEARHQAVLDALSAPPPSEFADQPIP